MSPAPSFTRTTLFTGDGVTTRAGLYSDGSSVAFPSLDAALDSVPAGAVCAVYGPCGRTRRALLTVAGATTPELLRGLSRARGERGLWR